MNSARIRRGTPPRSKAGRPAKTPGRALKKRTWLDRVFAALPVSKDTLERLATWTIVAILLGALAGLAMFLGLPAMARQELAEAAAHAGFEVKKVEVQGIERMDSLQIYNIALGQVDRSMLAVDLSALHGQMIKIGWVKDARISRRLPNTLVVDIVERQPVAVWQHDGQLNLIDVDGVQLEPVDAAAMPDLPLVVGPAANYQTKELSVLLDVAPALKPMLAGATWVGNRRWDLRFQSGETLLLPEGDKAAASALVAFARMDGVNRLLGRGIVRFDMRDPDKMVLRLPGDRPGMSQQRQLDMKAATGENSGNDAATDTSKPAVTTVQD